jgi:glycosyltransferase involved in cell wall biosynthesis
VDHPADTEPGFLIHHDFESRFTDFPRPSSHRTRCIAVRTWDFGPLPPAWVAKINREFDRYWAHSSWIAEQALAGGVDRERIGIVPHGIDPAVFHSDGARQPLLTSKTFRFLFVGGVSLRKGSDVLLEAYHRAFTRQDDVCLVLKDHSADLFYRENDARGKIAQLMARPDAPELLHLDAFLPDHDLAALYRSCDVAVFPYRAEGFCIPILEAMGCGTPAIVPDFGACRDYCDARTSWLMPVRRIRAPVNRSFSVALGFQERVAEVDFCEVPVDTLVKFLREVRSASPAQRAAKAAAGLEVARGFTWEKTGDRVLGELKELEAR